MIRLGLLMPLCLALMPAAGAWAAQGDPRVRLQQPERGERRYVAPAAIAIEAHAEAARGRRIVKVEFFADDQPVGRAFAAPYETVWTQVPEGRYRLRARATDDRGATGWSAPVAVRVHENREPRVRLISPHPGERYGAPATIELRAQARDRDRNLARVEFYADGVLLGTDTAPRYRLSWTGVAAGSYSVWARAVDALGATHDSRPVAIVVTGNRAPSVALTSPAAGAVIPAPGTFTLTAAASDPDGTVAQVEFFEGATPVATVATPPYTVTVNNVQAGGYSFTARATDDSGASATSAPVNVTVNAAVARLYYIHVDHLNTPRLVADATGTTVWRWDQSEPFGSNPPDENPSGLGTFDLPLRLPGQYFDAETALHYNYFRDYDSSLGIYKQSDLIGLQGGLNTYAYVAGNPLSTTDERGLFGPGGAAAGAAVSVLIQTLTCRALGGDFSICLKCIDWSDVAVSAAVGTVFPTWLGDVGKSIALAGVLSRVGVAGVGGATRKETVDMAVGAAVGTGVGVAAKVSSPSVQIECEDRCEPYRLPSVVKGLSTSVF